MSQVTVRVTLDELRQLDEYCTAYGKTHQEVLAESLRAVIDRDTGKKTAAPPAKSKAEAKSGKDGRS